MLLCKKITLTAILFYLVTSAITDFSLTGFWTDILVSIGFTFFALRLGLAYHQTDLDKTCTAMPYRFNYHFTLLCKYYYLNILQKYYIIIK